MTHTMLSWISPHVGCKYVLNVSISDPTCVDYEFGLFQIQLYMHTLPQVFSLDDFYNVICKVPKNVRMHLASFFPYFNLLPDDIVPRIQGQPRHRTEKPRHHIYVTRYVDWSKYNLPGHVIIY